MIDPTDTPFNKLILALVDDYSEQRHVSAIYERHRMIPAGVVLSIYAPLEQAYGSTSYTWQAMTTIARAKGMVEIADEIDLLINQEPI